MTTEEDKKRMLYLRQRGCLFGLAVGDALGAPVEFKQPGEFPPVVGYQNGGPHQLFAGEWTDDTSMALALADSIGNMGWNLTDQINRYCDWWMNGKYSVNGFCFDIGCTTRTALNKFVETHHVEMAGDTDEAASGNGSIMRLAPVPIKYGRHGFGELMTIAEDSSRTTHASEQCLSACRYLTAVLADLMNGVERDVILSPTWERLAEINNLKPLHPLVQKVAEGSFRQPGGLMGEGIKGSGWVVASLEAALWAFHDATSFEETVLRAVNLGDDADTTGAVAGQLAGAYWGVHRIPADWQLELARRDMIEAALTSLGVSE